MKYLSFLLIAMLSFGGLSAQVLPENDWVAQICRNDGRVIPFQIHTSNRSGKTRLWVENATEKLEADSVLRKDDSVYVKMPFFGSYFKLAVQKDGSLAGMWYKHYAALTQILPMKVFPGKKDRFENAEGSGFNFTGRWEVHFSDASFAIGEFVQKGTSISGTFLTPTGDFRFLDGNVRADTMQLSTFDGGHAYLFKAIGGDTLKGNFYFGARGVDTWTAFRNDSASLPDPYTQTKLKVPGSKASFAFRDVRSGKIVSINDPYYRGKVVVVELMGSWCPNCMDETAFLSKYYREHKKQGFEVIALSFENSSDFKEVKQLLNPFIKHFDVSYPVLFTSVKVSDQNRSEKVLPILQSINAFPTTLFVDKKGQVRLIYTGFTGPGTGDHYEIFQKDFDNQVQMLLKEKE